MGIFSNRVTDTAIHHIDGAGFQEQQVEGMHVVQLALGNMDKARNAALQVERKCAQGNSDKHKSMVVESRA